MSISKIDSGGIAASGITADSLDIGQIGGRRNLIINGAMVHDQRNGGSSVTPTVSGTYTLDRWRAVLSLSSKYSVQQSTVAPTNFNNSLLVTSLASTSLSASDQYRIDYGLEGYDVAHLNFGTAEAQSVTLSFWVRSSLTGNFGAAIFNNGANRCYPFNYTISSADTWEKKTVTITGDTTGTWLTNNGAGIYLSFSLGVGSSFEGTADAWTSSTHLAPSSSVSVVGTSGATWYITGVQLEVGSVATPFEHRSYGEELALCQRYYYMLVNSSTQAIGLGVNYSSSSVMTTVYLPVTMRATPTLEVGSGTSYYEFARNGGTDYLDDFFIGNRTTTRIAELENNTDISGTEGSGGFIRSDNASSFIAFDAEL